ncbi:hypothetical protein PVAP13_7NG221517 [Panicum virgatum]|uniref:Uncharacterized protein n=1 Tax=Panicum virgatum TaxID=38727 RepID=A0A8T0Q1T1_PANVG|nr:hypothetical protein PVAP13_7NG221517 [Panicum virgatum]
MAAEEVYVDWRGNAVDDRRHGGIRATLFLYVLFMLRSCPSSSNYSVEAYFQGTLHLDIVTSSTVIGYLVGTVLVSAALMNFISDDAYIKRTTAIFVFGPCVVLGYTLLALQAHFPLLHPETCEINKELNNCKPVKGWNLTLLYMSLLLFGIGEGCMRSCIPSLGGDQFSNDDPKKSQLKSMFLICLKFANSLGAIIGLVFLVWIENNLGWDIGFMICALIVLVGLLVAASGMPFYRMQNPIGSPLTTTLERQAIVDVIELQETARADCIHKSGTKVDETTKAITRMLPEQSRYLLPLIAIPTAFHVLMQPCYSRVLTPLLRTTIGHECRITPLQRIGAGSVCGTAAACIATLVEAKRMTIVEQHGLTSRGTAVPMSVFWLVIQYILLSIMDAASFGGLVEFIKSDAPPTMKPIAPAVQSFLAGFAAWSCCAFIQLVNRATRHGDGGRGWLDGTNFNRTRLDHFFLLLTVFELVALINYTFWARRYTRKLQCVSTVGLDEDNSRN